MVAQHFSVDKMHVAAGFNIISTPHLFSASSPPAHSYPWAASAGQRSPLTPFLCPLIPQLLGHWKARGAGTCGSGRALGNSEWSRVVGGKGGAGWGTSSASEGGLWLLAPILVCQDPLPSQLYLGES